MGVVNITPDSFSDGGRFFHTKAAIERAVELQAEGADIIDIGGESTRPGAEWVSLSEELRRVIPVIETLAGELTIPISIDTSKPGVASRALAAGAGVVNDISGLQSEEMMKIIAQNNAGVIIMHMKGTPADMQRNPEYDHVIGEITEFLQKRKSSAIVHGIDEAQIALDPGIGFGKRLQDNLEILQQLRCFKKLASPLLVGPSRKSFIGTLTGLVVDERLEGTLASVVLAAANGADIVRVHDVAAVKRALLVADAIVRRN
jgi:dihydropteroate synthase